MIESAKNDYEKDNYYSYKAAKSVNKGYINSYDRLRNGIIFLLISVILTVAAPICALFSNWLRLILEISEIIISFIGYKILKDVNSNFEEAYTFKKKSLIGIICSYIGLIISLFIMASSPILGVILFVILIIVFIVYAVFDIIAYIKLIDGFIEVNYANMNKTGSTFGAVTKVLYIISLVLTNICSMFSSFIPTGAYLILEYINIAASFLSSVFYVILLIYTLVKNR